VFGDTKGAIIIGKSKDRQHNGQKKMTKEQTTIYKIYTKTKDRVTRTSLSLDDVNTHHNALRFNILMFQVP
jgi:hypothetical protein